MKKIVLMIGFLLMALALIGQSINGVELGEIQVKYIVVEAGYRFMGNNMEVFVDYGQEKKGKRESVLKDEEGRVIEFETEVEVVNWLGNYGYDLKFVMGENINGREVKKYWMKREVRDEG